MTYGKDCTQYHTECDDQTVPVYAEASDLKGDIVDVDVDTSSQSTDYGAAAEPDLEAQILAANGGPIDGVSGATLTSMAVKEAYADVLAQAGLAS